jgi:tetratricopeptide (TPR) repeat protein
MTELADLLTQQGDHEGAARLYIQALDSGNVDIVPKAATKLGGLLLQGGDLEGACAALQQAIDSGPSNWLAEAAWQLSIALNQRGDKREAQKVHKLAMDKASPELRLLIAIFEYSSSDDSKNSS